MALELKDLTDDERLALVALLERVIGADHTVSDSEANELRKIIAAIGKKAYRAAVEEADSKFKDEETLRRFLPKIERQEARELIYETVLEAALAEVPVQPETEILEWIARIWKVEARIVESPEQGSD